MVAKQQRNPEKIMLFLFPLITLSLFILAILLSRILPQLFGY